jgi:peptidoglycan/xylan/chitin deacetylase (PgdA/CDA1 family)
MKGQRLGVIVACVCLAACLVASISGVAPRPSGGPDRLVPSSSPTYALIPARTFPEPPADPLAAPLPSAVPDAAYHVPVLMYHRIVPKSEAGNSLASMMIEPEVFRSQLRELHRGGWRTMTLDRLAATMRVGARVSPRTFAITIDDGWDDGYRYALPILHEFGYNATFFVISNRIGSPGFLSQRQMLELEAAGDEIGNHTMGHVALSTLDYPQAVHEIDGASAALERVLGHRPTSLSYPKSGVAPFVVDAARVCPGLEIAVTTSHGMVESWRTRFETPRVNVDSSVSGAALLAELEAG